MSCCRHESLLDCSLKSDLNVGSGRDSSCSRLQRSGPVQRHSGRHSRQPLHNSSVRSMVPDTTLISSLLEESSTQESSPINTLWGLDEDVDPTENSFSEETSTHSSSKHLTQVHSELFFRGCNPQPEARPYLTAASQAPEPSIFCQDQNRGSCTAHQCRGLCRQWNQLTSSPHLTRFSSTLFWVLLPLLLLLSLGWLCFAGFQSLLTSVNISARTTEVSNTQDLSFTNRYFVTQRWSAGDAFEELKDDKEGLLFDGATESRAQKLSDSERLLQVEQSLTVLWKQMEAEGQQEEELQTKVICFYFLLQQQPLSQREHQVVEHWLKWRLDREPIQLHRKLNKEMHAFSEQVVGDGGLVHSAAPLQRILDAVQSDLQYHLQQQRKTSRLDQLEQQLQTLANKIQELELKQETSPRGSSSLESLSAAVSLGGSSFHDVLLAKVGSRLEAAIGDIYQDVAHMPKRWDGCQQLGSIKQMISKQVSKLVGEEVRALVYGNQLTYRSDAVNLPELLLTWLSQQFVSSTKLEVALLSLELSILQNVSLQLQQYRIEEMAAGAAPTGGGSLVSKKDVHVMLRDALQRLSEDGTGMADYALESAGGSILSTRCTETYETKGALLSMFGVPLWPFSQSPRTVIQPDVHPGNCWAFRGSMGFLVIRLSMNILPTAFTLEHIPKALAPSGKLLSAPRDFSVYGLQAENQEQGMLLGTFTYREDGEALQTFFVTEENKEFFQIIEVRVLSNWGHPDYTCMYRFRVHGTPN